MLQVRVTWGTIQGMQPTNTGGFQMHAGDKPQCLIPISANSDIYATATIDSSTLLWNDAYIYMVAAGTVTPNTATQAYELIGAVSIDATTGLLHVAQSMQGNVYFDPSELV
jgi:hypothetical protein